MLDTDVAIHLRDGHLAVIDRVAALGTAPMLSMITRVELEGGAHRDAADRLARRARLDAMIAVLPVVAFDAAAAAAYRGIVAQCGFNRARLIDRMIAAHAISRDVGLVTLNGDDFADIPDLVLERWAA